MTKNLQLLGLQPGDQDEVARILVTCIPGYEVWAFGSRAKGTAKPYSDLDLAIVSERPLPLSVLAELREAFEESDLTIKVDVVDWGTIGEAFRKTVEDSRIVVQQKDS